MTLSREELEGLDIAERVKDCCGGACNEAKEARALISLHGKLEEAEKSAASGFNYGTDMIETLERSLTDARAELTEARNMIQYTGIWTELASELWGLLFPDTKPAVDTAKEREDSAGRIQQAVTEARRQTAEAQFHADEHAKLLGGVIPELVEARRQLAEVRSHLECQPEDDLAVAVESMRATSESHEWQKNEARRLLGIAQAAIEDAPHAYCAFESEPHCVNCGQVEGRHFGREPYPINENMRDYAEHCKDGRGRPESPIWVPRPPRKCNCWKSRALAQIAEPQPTQENP